LAVMRKLGSGGLAITGSWLGIGRHTANTPIAIDTDWRALILYKV
jgi:hypothetical protein